MMDSTTDSFHASFHRFFDYISKCGEPLARSSVLTHQRRKQHALHTVHNVTITASAAVATDRGQRSSDSSLNPKTLQWPPQHAAAWARTVKEVVLCFTVLDVQKRAADACCCSGAKDVSSGATSSRAWIRESTAKVVRSCTHDLISWVVNTEAKTAQIIRDCLAAESAYAMSLSSTQQDSASLHVPLNPVHSHLLTLHEQHQPCQEGKEAASSLLKSWAGYAHYYPSCLRRSESASTTKATRTIASSAFLVEELHRFWKLHEEAEERARLRALRANDTEAFAQHVSLLKISALLQIMERTGDFMRSIGMRLKSKATSSLGTDTQALLEGTAVCSKDACASEKGSAPAVIMGTLSDEYRRFQEYVASAKSEYQLVHQVSVFVERQPTGLQATLLPHQMDGLRFLVSLYANRINGLLADEMGVGKTIQTLAFLLYLKEAREGSDPQPVAAMPQYPHLVLAPLSVIREWQDACEQFVPNALRVAIFQQLEDPVREAGLYDIVLLPIHAARLLRAEIAQVQWGYLVVDEAHKAVSNLSTRTAQAILAAPCERRLVLTGTPLNSDLRELWSLLYFLNPEVFTEGDTFDEVFRRPFAIYEAKEMELSSEERGLLVLRLHQILRPFMLRRTKKDVDGSLRMTSHTLRCPLTEIQRRVLDMLRGQKRCPHIFPHECDDDDESEGGSHEGDYDGEAGTAETVSATPEEEGAAFGLTQGQQRFEGEAATREVATASSRDAAERTAVVKHNGKKRAALVGRNYGLSSLNVSESTAHTVCNHAFLLPFFSRVLLDHGLDELSSSSPRAAAYIALASSGKFMMLHLLLSRLRLARRKAVIFTHWLDCIDLLMDYLAGQGWEDNAEVLTGATHEAERKSRVRRFREDPDCLLFLVSIKAGGCGINLQAAHLVILLDRDYTTTNEDQALARVFRIGQRHTVRAVYLATDDAAEARVMRRAEVKNKPRQSIIEEGNYQVGGEDEPNNGSECVAHLDDEGDEEEGAMTQPEQPSFFTRRDTRHEEETCSLLDSSPLWEAAHHRTRTCAEADASQSFSIPDHDWSELRRLVVQLDLLALTDEDRSAVPPVLPDLLFARLPPASSAQFEAQRQAEVIISESGTNFHTMNAALPNETDAFVHAAPIKSRNDDTAATAAGDLTMNEESEAGLARLVEATSSLSGTSNSTVVTTPDESSRAGVLLFKASSTLEPYQNAHYWAQWWRLFQEARQGPQVLTAALERAVRNDEARASGVELVKRQAKRAREAERQMRLLSVDPPQSFWQECWDAGIEDDESICERYLETLQRKTREKQERVLMASKSMTKCAKSDTIVTAKRRSPGIGRGKKKKQSP